METGKPGLASAPVHISSVSAQAENRMDTKAPLTAVYIHKLPEPRPPSTATACEPATLHLAVAPLYSKEMLPFLTLNIAGGLQSQLGLGAAAVAAPVARLKSAGKHVCPHCGRDCMKPSVLEKHLRCHTGERPYPCTTCGVSFKTQSNLYKHRRTQAHARLSSESEHSSLGSLDNSSRENCTASLSLDERSQDSGCMQKVSVQPVAEAMSSIPHVFSVRTQSSPSELRESNVVGHNREVKESEKTITEDNKQTMGESKASATVSQHLPLQRQEATLFSKQWERSLSQGKSQNHESTDSGFSESSDHYPSPSSLLPEHSMDSLSESTREAINTASGTHGCGEPRQGGQELDDAAREQEKKSLEERISKLISDNTAVVEDKQLENVRPRKTVLSKQGSIDLPMPYTYKDSFHFEMRNTQGIGLHANRKPGLFSSVPTQRSSTVEHALLTRSNSLPFSVTLLQPEKSSPAPYSHSDYVTLVRRGSSGQINPTGFTIRPVNQHSSTHRPLVRQTAVDCNSAADGLFVTSSVEEACAGSLSCDGDICGEPSNRKYQRKKAQKFAYNKWYMYRGGTFKKLYSPERDSDNSAIRGRKCSTNPEHEVAQGLKRSQSVHKGSVTASLGSTLNLPDSSAAWCTPDCSPTSLPSLPAVDLNQQTSTGKAPKLRRNLSLSVLPSPSSGPLMSPKAECVSRAEVGRLIHEGKHSDTTSQLGGTQFPSNRKKQRTECKVPVEMETTPGSLTYSPPSVTNISPQQGTNVTYINLNTTPTHAQLEGALSPPCKTNADAPCVRTSTVESIPSPAKKSFLPKYQLKLPNTAGSVSNSSSQLADKTTETLSSTSSACQNEPSLNSVAPCAQTYKDPAASPPTQTCNVTHKIVCSAQHQVMLTHPFTTVGQNLPSCLAGAQRRSGSATITTSCLQDHQAGLCSTLMQSSRSAVGSKPVQTPPPAAHPPPSAPLSLTAAAVNHTSAAAVPTFSHLPYPHPDHPSSELSNSGPKKLAGPDALVVPCHMVSLDQSQLATQNIFHVNTADLQICLQIISDEQLALIEPQIERPSSCSPSQVPPDSVQNKVRSFATTESNNRNQGHTHSDKGECLLRITPPLSVQLMKAAPGLNVAEGSKLCEASAAPSGTPRPPLHPHSHAMENTGTKTQSNVGDPMTTVASLGGVNSERSQTSVKVQAFSQSCTKEQLLSKGGRTTQTPSSSHQLRLSSPSLNSPHQVKGKSELVQQQGQDKVNNEGGSSEASLSQTPGEEVLAWRSSRVDGGTLTLHTPFKHADVGLDSTGPSHDGARSLTRTSQDSRCSAHSEKQLGQLILQYSNIPKEKRNGISDVLTSTTPECLEGAALTECAAQKMLQSREQNKGELEPDSANWRLKQLPAAGGTSQRSLAEDRQDAGGDRGSVTGEKDIGGMRPLQLPAHWDSLEPGYTCPQVQGCKGEDGKVKVDAIPNSRLSEEHPRHLSQMHSGMSDCSPQRPQPAPSSIQSSCSPGSGLQLSLHSLPKPHMEGNHPGLSQQTHKSSIIHEKALVSCESSSTTTTNTWAHFSEGQNVLSGSESGLELTHVASNQDSKPASITKSNQGNTTADNSCMGASCRNELQSGGSTNTSLFPEVGMSSCTHSSQAVQVPSGDIQTIKNHHTVHLPKTSTFPEKDNKQDPLTKASHGDWSQSVVLAGSLCAGCQPIEVVRPVPSCQDYNEDTSSSDEEGKLIIEL